MTLLVARVTALNSPTRRRWFRFGLRSLLVFTALVGLLMGWIVKERKKSARDYAIADKLIQKGWGVRFVGPLDSLALHSQQKDPDWWRRIAGDVLGRRVDSVNGSCISRVDLSPLAELTELVGLVLLETDARDLAPLAGLKKLRLLSIVESEVSDLKPLESLKTLKFLKISKSRVHDVTPLRSLTGLETLVLLDTQVRDLTPLAGLKNLKQLTFGNTPVTQKQIETLQKALPDCKVELDPPPPWRRFNGVN